MQSNYICIILPHLQFDHYIAGALLLSHSILSLILASYSHILGNYCNSAWLFFVMEPFLLFDMNRVLCVDFCLDSCCCIGVLTNYRFLEAHPSLGVDLAPLEYFFLADFFLFAFYWFALLRVFH